MRLSRLFRLLDQLRVRHVPVTASDMAAELGVSPRTLYRDIADLQALGAPIRGEGGVGYVMEPGYFMPSLRLETEELEALALGTRMVAARAEGEMARAAGRAAAKIASAVAEPQRRAFLDAPFQAGPSGGPEHFDRLSIAIRGFEVLEIDYTALNDRKSTRLARPLGLTVFDHAWLLTIWCETAEDFRHLRVDRIDALRETGRRFRPERGKRLSDCLEQEHNHVFPTPERKGSGLP